MKVLLVRLRIYFGISTDLKYWIKFGELFKNSGKFGKNGCFLEDVRKIIEKIFEILELNWKFSIQMFSSFFGFDNHCLCGKSRMHESDTKFPAGNKF